MIFIIHSKKYDTDKMEKIADVKKWYRVESVILSSMFGEKQLGRVYDCELWKSQKGNWLITREEDYSKHIGEAISESEAKELLMRHALNKYEQLFGEIEEA